MKKLFTFRDLFWLLLVCAIAYGWWSHWKSLSYNIEDMKRAQSKWIMEKANLLVELAELEKYRPPQKLNELRDQPPDGSVQDPASPP